MIWHTAVNLDALHEIQRDTAADHLGIQFTEFGDNWLMARMAVDSRTVQPFRILHGGASVLLAETVGSAASNLCLNNETHYAVGLDINANHIAGARSGNVYGRAEPIHLGRSTHVWQIRISDDSERLICVSRLTMSILERK
ncbi:MAG TPA: hotdog fold thioesterase [Noviherbaspirillum sp.]|jgi:1,4-dihydroxy-2-naphthoyl-CoA hydrolase|uniref:hotdog fold thioesterase n=1 Tax=Noviherbaspirillum sp. TaxID=1926288 RepID=UPI002F95C2D2